MHDYYQILGIARDASPQVVKFAFEGKMKAVADPAYVASPAEKREEERLLKEAFVTLSMPAKRGPYDEKLAAFESGAGGGASRPAWLVPAAVVAVLAIGASMAWVNHSREQERQRLEAERVAAQEEEARRRAEREAERIREAEARQEEFDARNRERNEQYRAQRERADLERWRRSVDAQARQGDYARESRERNAAYEARREEQRRRSEEDRLRREEEARRRQAQYEVERQKDFLRRQEQEEERVRLERHYRAQQEAQEREYRRMIEERNRGVAPR